MSRVTLGVSASCLTANIALRTNALKHAHQYPLASKIVTKWFYANDEVSHSINETRVKAPC